MRADVRDAGELNALRPLDVVAYLRSRGWEQQGERNETASIWTKRIEANEFEILLPLDTSLRDFARRMGDVLDTLAVAERRSQLQLLSDLRSDSLDVVRVRLDVRGDASGGIDLNDVVRAIPNVRDMMMAAACAAVEPREYYHARKFGQAEDYLGRLKMGHTEPGSFIIKVLSRVPPLLEAQSQLFPADDAAPPPFARQVTESLMRGLQAATSAAQRAVAVGDVHPFIDAVSQGASANLIDALVGIGGEQESAFEINMSWASTRRVPSQTPERVTITPDVLPVFAEASRLFKDKSPREEFELEGIVIRLDRQPGEGSGVVRIMGAVEGKTRKVSVELPASSFDKAIQAFEGRSPVRVLGELHRDGAGFRLDSPRHFDLLPGEP